MRPSTATVSHSSNARANQTGIDMRTFPFSHRDHHTHLQRSTDSGFSSPTRVLEGDLRLLSLALGKSKLLPPIAEAFLNGHNANPLSESSLDRFKIDRDEIPDTAMLAGLIAYVIGKEESTELPGAFLKCQLEARPAVELADNYIAARLIQLSSEEPKNGQGQPFNAADQKQIRANAARLADAAVAAYIRQIQLTDIDDATSTPHRLKLSDFSRILINIKRIVDSK